MLVLSLNTSPIGWTVQTANCFTPLMTCQEFEPTCNTRPVHQATSSFNVLLASDNVGSTPCAQSSVSAKYHPRNPKSVPGAISRVYSSQYIHQSSYMPLIVSLSHFSVHASVLTNPQRPTHGLPMIQAGYLASWTNEHELESYRMCLQLKDLPLPLCEPAPCWRWDGWNVIQFRLYDWRSTRLITLPPC